MQIKIGCDVVSVEKFKKAAREKGVFLDKIFSRHELSAADSAESLAGMFAAKEAVVKALGLNAGEWHNIEIVKCKSGKPEAKILAHNVSIISQDVSISHDGDYAFAIGAFLLE